MPAAKEIDPEMLRQLYIDDEFTQGQIAAMLDVSRKTIWNRLAEYGITRPERARPGVRDPYVIPDGVDYETRNVLAYVNGEIERFRRGDRDEPIDLICLAADERLRRIPA